MEKTKTKLNYADFYKVEKVIKSKLIDKKFRVRLIEGTNEYKQNVIGVDIIFKDQYLSAVSLFSKERVEGVKELYKKIKNFEAIYRFISLFQV